jgi:hypothetical protein
MTRRDYKMRNAPQKGYVMNKAARASVDLKMGNGMDAVFNILVSRRGFDVSDSRGIIFAHSQRYFDEFRRLKFHS